MTRKEELRKIADTLVCNVYTQVDNDGDMSTCVYESCVDAHANALLQVERECWNRALDNITDIRAAEWIKKQKEAL